MSTSFINGFLVATIIALIAAFFGYHEIVNHLNENYIVIPKPY